jgi:thioredoxin 1
MANVLTLTDANFKSEVLDSPTPVLVDFSATWCGPCKQLAPIVEQLATEYSGQLKVGAVDVDQARETAMRYGIMSVPTIMLFRAGQVKDQVVGFATKAALKERIGRVMA